MRTEKQLHHTQRETGCLEPETHPRNSSKGAEYRVKKKEAKEFLQTLPKLTNINCIKKYWEAKESFEALGQKEEMWVSQQSLLL